MSPETKAAVEKTVRLILTSTEDGSMPFNRGDLFPSGLTDKSAEHLEKRIARWVEIIETET